MKVMIRRWIPSGVQTSADRGTTEVTEHGVTLYGSIRPINTLTAKCLQEVAWGATCDRYENCKHDGYRKDLARPVIRRHDDLQKVHDYDLGSESLANARRRDTMVAPNDGINHGSRAPDGTSPDRTNSKNRTTTNATGNI
jgi:hypothetical protein